MIRKIFIVLFITFTFFANAQDTLTVMQYNLLNYGNFTSYCTGSNNNVSNKDSYLTTITKYVKPDIFTVNEMSESSTYQNRVLYSVLNTAGVNYYKKSGCINSSNSPTVNMLYYNSEKLGIKSQKALSTNYRDIDIYRLYYKPQNTDNFQDTIFINCIVAHLKASQGYEAERAAETKKVMDYLNSTNSIGNYFFMGDFNIYTNTEQAFQNLINYSNEDIRFYDPINQIGYWHNNYDYAKYHTQSTHSTSNGCASSGGMDDRFDYILCSSYVLNNTDKVSYINDSYKALGQDGNHFNKSVNSSPVNTSVPSDVLDALYNMSDHLPVILKLKVDNESYGINEQKNNYLKLYYNNPVKDELKLSINSSNRTNVNIDIYNVYGQLVFKDRIQNIFGLRTFNYHLSYLQKSIYFIIITDEKNHNKILKKLIKQ